MKCAVNKICQAAAHKVASEHGLHNLCRPHQKVHKHAWYLQDKKSKQASMLCIQCRYPDRLVPFMLSQLTYVGDAADSGPGRPAKRPMELED